MDPYHVHSFSSYTNQLGTDKKYLYMRFIETINLIEMGDFVDTDFLINRVILILMKQISIGSPPLSIMFCVLSHLDLHQ